MKFSEKLKAARELKGISVDDLAGKLKVSRQTIYDWESGKSEPRKAKLDKLREILNMDHPHHTEAFVLPRDQGSKEVRVIPADVWQELQENNAVFKIEIDRLWSLVNRLTAEPVRSNKA